MAKDFIMNYKNAKQHENGSIDCEIEHPVHGWIPTTLDINDAETAELFGLVNASGTVAEYIAPPLPTQAELTAAFKATALKAVQAHLDDTAKLSGYDSIISACSYAGAVNPFQSESVKFIEWRGDVWQYCYTLLDEFTAGTTAQPTIDELINQLPNMGA